jgi:hypothetical protein
MMLTVQWATLDSYGSLHGMGIVVIPKSNRQQNIKVTEGKRFTYLRNDHFQEFSKTFKESS